MNLLNSHCLPNAAKLDHAALAALLVQVPQWAIEDGLLVRRFAFRNYYQCIAFVNALAWVSHQQDHHPELVVTFKQCVVRYNTHSAGGALSENDFICAAMADAIYGQRATA